MLIQWYPGHMTKAFRMMEENRKLVDGAIVALDARAPFSSRNPKLEAAFGEKPVLYVLNKCDLIEKADEARYLAALRAQGLAAAVSSSDPKTLPALREAVRSLLAEKRARLLERGISKPLRLMVTGVPNTGKSTIINRLAGAAAAKAGNKAGVTRGKQWVRVGEFELLDTPGLMPPAFEDQTAARRLALLGCINDDILDFPALAAEFLGEYSARFPAAALEKYGVGADLAADARLEAVAKRRGYLLRGGEADYERAARAVVDDLRKGRLGKIALDGAEEKR